MNHLGRFITFEGGEGTGKSTHARRLAHALEEHGVACVLTREPGGSPGAEEIRRLLVRGDPNRWTPVTEALLLFAARADHVARTIKPALAAGKWVICDRFTDSTYAYQSGGGGLERETVHKIESAAIDEFKPDFTFVLDLPVETGLRRARARRGREKRFERFDADFHERLRLTFLAIAEQSPERYMVIDASADEDVVAATIFAAVTARFALK